MEALAPPPTRRRDPALAAKESPRLREGIAAGVVVLLAAWAIAAGQFSLDLLTMDDLREAELAREMLEGGDYVVPHLAGLPFVEKPPGYTALLALTFRLSGGPSVPAARWLTVVVAFSTLAAVFLLGKRVAGPRAGALAAATLSVSVCFNRTAHTILLDNALTAALAWALYFGWLAWEAPAGPAKRARYAAAALEVGVSFLFKGFVGPALAGAGFLAAVALTGRWRECRAAAHPLVLGCFALPVLAWVVPFLRLAEPGLWYEFFVANHVGRALHAYESHQRSFTYYALTLWPKFAPGSLLLPFSAARAWKDRRHPEGRAGIFLLAFAAGGIGLLSLPSAKDDTYLLPVYPALSVLVAVWAARRLEGDISSGTKIAPLVVGIAALLLAGFYGVSLGGVAPAVASAAVAGLLLLGARRCRETWAAELPAALACVTVALLCLPPISTAYVKRRDPRPAFDQIARLCGDRDLLLYHPDDRLRGGCGFYRRRTALEVPDASRLVDQLRTRPGALALVIHSQALFPELADEAARQGVSLVEEATIPAAGLNQPATLVRVAPLPATPQ